MLSYLLKYYDGWDNWLSFPEIGSDEGYLEKYLNIIWRIVFHQNENVVWMFQILFLRVPYMTAKECNVKPQSNDLKLAC